MRNHAPAREATGYRFTTITACAQKSPLSIPRALMTFSQKRGA
jgi:hypothetical protein